MEAIEHGPYLISRLGGDATLRRKRGEVEWCGNRSDEFPTHETLLLALPLSHPAFVLQHRARHQTSSSLEQARGSLKPLRYLL